MQDKHPYYLRCLPSLLRPSRPEAFTSKRHEASSCQNDHATSSQLKETNREIPWYRRPLAICIRIPQIFLQTKAIEPVLILIERLALLKQKTFPHEAIYDKYHSHYLALDFQRQSVPRICLLRKSARNSEKARPCNCIVQKYYGYRLHSAVFFQTDHPPIFRPDTSLVLVD